MVNALIARPHTSNVAQNIGEGNALRLEMENAQRQRDYRNMLAQYGPEIAQGDPAALGQLAQFDPGAALDVQSTRQTMDIRGAQEGRAAELHPLKLKETKMRMSAAAAEAARQERDYALIEGVAKLSEARRLFKQDPAAAWRVARDHLGEEIDGLEPHLMTPEGQAALGLVIASGLEGLSQEAQLRGIMEAPEGGYRQITGDEAAAMGLDPNRAYNVGPDGKITAIGASPTETTVYGADGQPVYRSGPAGMQEVEQGRVGEGRVRVRDEQGNLVDRVIPGSEAAADQQAEREAQQARDESQEAKANIVLSNINDARDYLTGGRTQPLTGLSGGAMSWVPGSERRDLEAAIQTIQAHIGFAELNQMRQESPTGGALGQVTERELAFLQALMGNLDLGQSKERILEQLDAVENEYKRIKSKIERTGDGTPVPGFTDGLPGGGFAEGASTPGVDLPRIGEVVDGYEFIGGDPAIPDSWRQVN